MAMERSTIFNGKNHYFYGHFQLLCNKLPEGTINSWFHLMVFGLVRILFCHIQRYLDNTIIYIVGLRPQNVHILMVIT